MQITSSPSSRESPSKVMSGCTSTANGRWWRPHHLGLPACRGTCRQWSIPVSWWRAVSAIHRRPMPPHHRQWIASHRAWHSCRVAPSSIQARPRCRQRVAGMEAAAVSGTRLFQRRLPNPRGGTTQNNHNKWIVSVTLPALLLAARICSRDRLDDGPAPLASILQIASSPTCFFAPSSTGASFHICLAGQPYPVDGQRRSSDPLHPWTPSLRCWMQTANSGVVSSVLTLWQWAERGHARLVLACRNAAERRREHCLACVAVDVKRRPVAVSHHPSCCTVRVHHWLPDDHPAQRCAFPHQDCAVRLWNHWHVVTGADDEHAELGERCRN